MTRPPAKGRGTAQDAGSLLCRFSRGHQKVLRNMHLTGENDGLGDRVGTAAAKGGEHG